MRRGLAHVPVCASLGVAWRWLPPHASWEGSLVESEDVVVAEVYVQLVRGSPGATGSPAFLHRTLATDRPRHGGPGARDHGDAAPTG